MSTDPGEALSKARAKAVEVEEVAQRGLEVARGKHETDRQFCALVAQRIGLTPAVMDMLVASGRDLAAAEARFGATVESREALDRLIAELREVPD